MSVIDVCDLRTYDKQSYKISPTNGSDSVNYAWKEKLQMPVEEFDMSGDRMSLEINVRQNETMLFTR